MKGTETTCRKCGQRIAIITWGIYRNVVVDPECFMVVPDPESEEEFVRIDGSKFTGREQRNYMGDEPAEPAYRMHRKTCGARR